MADLWERITGDNLGDNPAVGQDKIAIHSFWGMISEWDRGYETQANVLAAFDIQAGIQTTQAQSIKQHITQRPTRRTSSAFVRTGATRVRRLILQHPRRRSTTCGLTLKPAWATL